MVLVGAAVTSIVNSNGFHGNDGILIGVFAVGYQLPTFIAFGRGHSNAVGIMIFNILLGWTFVSWVWCLISACPTLPPIQVVHQDNVNYNVKDRVDHYAHRT
jgi:hypothetical protein